MEWLGGWLKTIIMIILLATFADLLLPNHSMQRYVKMAVSLLIVMTLITPLFELFQKNWDIGKLLDEAERRQSNLSLVPGAGATAASLEAILQESRKLAAKSEEQAKRLMEEQVAARIRQQIEADGNPVREVKVETAIDGQGRPEIRKVQVLLPPKETLTAAGAAGESGRPDRRKEPSSFPLVIEPVQPVLIEIGPIDLRAAREAAAGDGTDAETDRLRDEIRQIIHREWQVPLGQIEVLFA